ncbi:hypothetical protein JSY36_10750 [Bacillus sp. H-16]|uniref:hypothetical protein n=1 Tax=Alteribacter salitolerans TaxID=2912333 RepID=UPI001962AC67|nr:hypothetical protein [Alteribacter salitolerans]MBM7096236.1 hypothetical protein [Alteribacter salitolerans]
MTIAPTLLFEMRGMTDSPSTNSIFGQISNGYLINQAVTAIQQSIRAVADRSIYEADETIWDDLPTQYTVTPDSDKTGE